MLLCGTCMLLFLNLNSDTCWAFWELILFFLCYQTAHISMKNCEEKDWETLYFNFKWILHSVVGLDGVHTSKTVDENDHTFNQTVGCIVAVPPVQFSRHTPEGFTITALLLVSAYIYKMTNCQQAAADLCHKPFHQNIKGPQNTCMFPPRCGSLGSSRALVIILLGKTSRLPRQVCLHHLWLDVMYKCGTAFAYINVKWSCEGRSALQSLNLFWKKKWMTSSFCFKLKYNRDAREAKRRPDFFKLLAFCTSFSSQTIVLHHCKPRLCSK